jgi:hypothetical protein
MKRKIFVSVLLLSLIMFSACKRQVCYECHCISPNGDKKNFSKVCGDTEEEVQNAIYMNPNSYICEAPDTMICDITTK